MEWEDKVKLVQLGNQIYTTPHDKVKFYDYTIENMNRFDDQSWDMYFNIVDIIPSEMEEDIEYWKRVYPLVKKVDVNSKSFNTRTTMRIAMVQSICENELKL